MIINYPNMPYVSVKDAARILHLAPRTVYDYVYEGRLQSTKLADVIAIPMEEIQRFKREPAGRPRLNTPLWRMSSGENEQFMMFINVKIREHQQDALRQKLENIRKDRHHLFPGSVMRSASLCDESVMIVLIWRGTIMPDEEERQESLEQFKQDLENVLDWSTACYHSGPVLMHT